MKFGVARSMARCSIGWWVGPSSPTPDAVVGEDVGDRQAHERRQAHRRAHVVDEHEEGGHVRADRRRARPCRWPIAAMACSRTPKWKLRPAGVTACWSGTSLIRVLFEGARSAEPPISVGTCGATALMTLPEPTRVATAAFVGREHRQVGVPAGGQPVGPGVVPGGRAGRVGRAPGGVALAPRRVRGRAAAPRPLRRTP